MVKVVLTVIAVGWVVFAAGLTGFGGTQTGDWEYALGIGLKRIGYLAGMGLAVGSVVGVFTFFGGRKGQWTGGKVTMMMALGPALLGAVGTMLNHGDGFDPWNVLPGGPSWLVSSLERGNPEFEVEDTGEGGIAFYREDGERVTLWPWQLKGARLDWKKCAAGDLALLGAMRPAAPAECMHRVRVEAPGESFTLLAFSIGDSDTDAAVKAMQEQYERAGGTYIDHLVIEQGGARRRIEGRSTRRWGNWLYVEAIDKRG